MKNKILLFLKLCVSAAFLYFVISLINFDEVRSLLPRISIGYLVLALMLNIIGTIACKSYLVSSLLGGTFKHDFIYLFKANLSLRFYSVVLPRPAVAALRWFKYSKISDGKKSLTIVSYEALIYFFMLLSTAWIFIIIDNTPVSMSYLPLVSLLICIMFFSLLLILWFSRTSYRPRKFINLFPEMIKSRIRKLIELFSVIKEARLNSFRTIIFTYAMSLISFLFFLAGSYVLALALNLSISLATLAWIRIMVMLLAMLPITIGGIGLREAGFVSLLGKYGVTPEESLLYSLSTFLLQIAIALVGSLIEASEWIKKHV